jgi:hypothetical protein
LRSFDRIAVLQAGCVVESRKSFSARPAAYPEVKSTVRTLNARPRFANRVLCGSGEPSSWQAAEKAYLADYLLVHHDMRHTPRTRAFFDFVVSEMKSFRALVLGQNIPSADPHEVIE